MRIKIIHMLFTCFFITGLLLPGCTSRVDNTSNGQDLEGTISISGAFAMYPLVIRWGEEFHTLHPQVRFDISAGGAGKGMADTLAEAVDIGMVSREIYPQEEEQGAYWIPVAKDAVFLTVNEGNPILDTLREQGIQRETLEKFFIQGQIDTWGEVGGQPQVTDPLHIYTRSDACGAADTWAKYLGGNQEDLLGIGVYGDPGVLKAIQDDALGIGYNNLNFAYSFESGEPVQGIEVIPLDINNNGRVDPEEKLNSKQQAIQSVAEGVYPSPPARDLHLVTKEKPTGVIRAFLLWTLTDGQQYLGEVGYIPIPDENLEQALTKLGK